VAHTDASGRYTLDKLAVPGTYRITVSATLFSASRRSKTVRLDGAGLSGVDFEIDRDAEISGTVVNEEGEPLRGVNVYLLSKIYTLGQSKLVAESLARTDEDGAFRIPRVQPGKEYLLLAKTSGHAPPVSRVPQDPRVRKPALRPALHPETVLARSGERREEIEIRMTAGPSLCIEAQLEAGGEPGPLEFRFSDEYPDAGGRGGPAFGKAPEDGKVRICDFGPGEYRIGVMQPAAGPGDPPVAFGETAVTLTDRDARNVVVRALPRAPMSAEARWDGAPAEANISVYLHPLARVALERERPGLYARTPVPGNFQFPALFAGDHSIRVSGLKRGQYVKDITYGAQSVLHKPVPAGAPGVLRITLAHDGASLTVKAAPNAQVILLPASADSEASLAERIQQCDADQNGVCEFETVPPGKYYVRAQSDPVEPTRTGIAALWRDRAGNQEVEVGPRSAVRVTLRAD
jgi:hypothetical protein